MKILCLFVRHGTEKYPDALAELDQWYARHGLMGQRTLWIIDNALDAGFRPQVLALDTLLRAGDNQAWEFSAWAHALRDAEVEQIEYDVVHFVTSAFNTLYTTYLGHFCAEMLPYVKTHNVCLGHIDGYDQPVELAGSISRFWIRTCFFFLPAGVISRIATWAAFTDPKAIFSSHESTEFRPDAPLSPDYQRRIRIWLEGQDVGGHTWHSPIGSDPGEVGRFQKKTLAILNEHNFSVTLRRLPTPLVDYCWLWSQRHETSLQQLAVPAETAQLAIRRRILGISPESLPVSQ